MQGIDKGIKESNHSSSGQGFFSEKKVLETLFDVSHDGLIIFDAEGNILKENAAALRLNGFEEISIVGKNIRTIIKENDLDYETVILRVLEEKQQVNRLQYIKRTGKLLLTTGTPSFDKDGNLAFVVVNERDMTKLNDLMGQLQKSQQEIEKLEEELSDLNLLELKKNQIITESPEMFALLETSLKLAHVESSHILVLGESGTGKGLLAKFIHNSGKNKNRPFIHINCAALPETLLEAELFGYEKGAFTGATERGKAGLFELAHKGTLFLDEIGDAPISIQAKLLKYLDDHEVMRLGATRAQSIDCNIIAASNKDLESLVRKKDFREDLFYRLNTFTLKIPPLSERRCDIPVLVNHYLRKYNKDYNLDKTITPHALEWLRSYLFPGNVRELSSIIKSAVVLSQNKSIDDHILSTVSGEECVEVFQQSGGKDRENKLKANLKSHEKDLLVDAIKQFNTTRKIAAHLGISQSSVVRKMKKYGLHQMK